MAYEKNNQLKERIDKDLIKQFKNSLLDLKAGNIRRINKKFNN